MSDFLSNFTSDNYQKTEKEAEKKQSSEKVDRQANVNTEFSDHGDAHAVAHKLSEQNPDRAKEHVSKADSMLANDDLIVKDTTFAKKKLLKRLLMGVTTLVILSCIFVFYYNQTHIKLPDFTGKTVSTVQTWADKHQIKLAVKRSYNFDKKVNTVIKLPDKNKVIPKKKLVELTVSLGPNPKTKIKLPDFTKLSVAQARDFIKKEKLENTTIQLDYSETIEKDRYIKQAFANDAVTSAKFKREDNLTLFYSKGKEPIIKNIDVPDFSGQTKDQIATWSKEKGVKIVFESEGSNTVEIDKVIFQSVAKGQKVSKADSIIVKLSLGKPMIVPDFSKFSFDESGSVGKELPVNVKQVYSDTVPYGGFISQSIGAETQYFAKDNIPTISVAFSLGRVYIKDMTGQTEGELQATFYNDYTAKGATITYQVQYVDSSETKGVVVGQSILNEFVPLKSQMIIMISKGNEK